MGRWKTLTKTALCGAYKYTGSMWMHEAVARWSGQQFMTILLFHRITDAIPEDVLTVSTARFQRICRMLRAGFRVVGLDEIRRMLRSGERMPARTVAVTFDDCYHDNLWAARMLAEAGMPATFFVPTGFIGTDRVFEWDRGLPRMPNLSWDDVREIARMGHEIGSHSVNHVNLGAVGPEQAISELIGSRTMIQNHLDRPARWFAYPFGGRHHLRPEYLPLIQAAGYEGTFSAFGGFIEPGIDERILPREAVPCFHSVSHLEMFLAGCLHWLYAIKGRDTILRERPCPYGELAESGSNPPDSMREAASPGALCGLPAPANSGGT
jgi:peptidoglycan/xylan/chitin deacetylase (PgdA/CDA1 family)